MGNESIFIPSKGNRYFIIFPLHFPSFARRFFFYHFIKFHLNYRKFAKKDLHTVTDMN